jgi:FKBP-type peptidyl-prolyl cis-trans isomerase SlyD
MSPPPSPPAAERDEAVHRGDLVELDFELWSELPASEPELIDTTREEVAQRTKLKTPEGFVFGPRPHLIGGEYFPSGIENVLAGAHLGTEFQQQFPPAEAFGERDPKLIELFGMHEISRLPEMRREDAELDAGTVLTIKGRRGRVVSLTAARVRVDFNPPYAGRTIRGVFRIVRAIKEPAEQVRALLDIEYGRGREFHVEVKAGTVTIRVPDRSKFDVAWMATKPRIIERLRQQIKPHAIHLVEEYVTPSTAEAPGSGAASPAPPPEEAKGAAHGKGGAKAHAAASPAPPEPTP